MKKIIAGMNNILSRGYLTLNLGRTRRIYLDLGGDRKGQDHDAYPASCQP